MNVIAYDLALHVFYSLRRISHHFSETLNLQGMVIEGICTSLVNTGLLLRRWPFFYFLNKKGFRSREWANAFVLLGIGYAITSYQLHETSLVKSTIENFFFLYGSGAMASALTKRLSGAPRWKTKAIIIFCGLVGTVWALHFYQSVRLETFWVQAGCVAMLCYSLARSKEEKELNRGDRVLKATFVLVTLLLTLQCVGYLFTLDTAHVVGAWRNSTWGFFFELTGIGIAVSLTIAILLSISLDVIDKLKLTSITDSLTGLLNRRGFENAFVDLQMHASIIGDYFLVLIDFDHFKLINDSFGHDAGDQVLVQMAALMKKAVGSNGYAGRLGGEEFGVLLKATDAQAAALWSDELRRSLNEIRWDFNPANVPRSASFGVTPCSGDITFSETMRRADLRLYKAKQFGRNQVIWN